MKKKKDEITIRSSAAEYLTYVASVGDQQDSIEMRYEDENIWLTQKMMATLYGCLLYTATAMSPRRTARTKKHGIITTAKIRLHLPGMSAASD